MPIIWRWIIFQLLHAVKINKANRKNNTYNRRNLCRQDEPDICLFFINNLWCYFGMSNSTTKIKELSIIRKFFILIISFRWNNFFNIPFDFVPSWILQAKHHNRLWSICRNSAENRNRSHILSFQQSDLLRIAGGLLFLLSFSSKGHVSGREGSALALRHSPFRWKKI